MHTSLNLLVLGRNLTGEMMSSFSPDPAEISSLSPSLPIRGFSWTTPESAIIRRVIITNSKFSKGYKLEMQLDVELSATIATCLSKDCKGWSIFLYGFLNSNNIKIGVDGWVRRNSLLKLICACCTGGLKSQSNP